MLSSRFKNDGRENFVLTQRQANAKHLILQKFSSGIYEQTPTNCVLCSRNDYSVISEKDKFGLPMRTVICRYCSLIYSNPMISADSLPQFYGEHYGDLDRVLPDVSDYFELEKRKGQIIYEFLQEAGVIEKIRGKVVLDIGCGAGGVLGYFAQMGFKGLGCDYVLKHLNYGIQTHGLNLIHGDLEAIKKSLQTVAEPVGLIIYEQVFEHLPKPQEVLKDLRQFMPDNAFLFLGVPGILNIDFQYNSDLLNYLQVPHLVQYDLLTLSKMLNVSGFQMLKGNEVVRAVFVKTDTYSSVSENSFQAKIDFFHAAERRRRLKILTQAPRRAGPILLTTIKALIAMAPMSDVRKTRMTLFLKRWKSRVFTTLGRS